MRYAICNEVFSDRTLAEGFQAAAEIGYTGIELAPFTLGPVDAAAGRVLEDVRQLSNRVRRDVRSTAEASGLAIVGLHWLLAETQGFQLTSSDPAVRRATADYLAALAELCGDLGGRVAVLGSPQQRSLAAGVSPAAARGYAVDVLTAAMPAYEAAGVTLALEPLGPEETDFLNTAAEVVGLAERVGSPRCALLLDIKAMASETAPMAQIIRANRGHLAHFHANDPNRLGPGMGEVDIRPALRELDRIGYAGWVSVEPFRYEPSRDGVARQSLANLRAAEELG